MFQLSQLENFLFFDIETTGTVSDFEKLQSRMQDLWSSRSEILRVQLGEKYPDNKNKTDSELFRLKAGLQAEFGRVVCVSLGVIKIVNGTPTAQIVSYYGEDEKEILTKTFKVMNAMSKLGAKLIGHNVKRFDVPYLCKRAFINGIDIPVILQVWDKKPWETSIVDTSELWSFGAWQEGFTSLDLLTAILEIPSPKDDIKGDKVHATFYDELDAERIRTYCQKDVLSMIHVLMKLSGLNLIQDTDIVYK
jgi:DNA polymerase elongation subunit (family B)